MTVCASCSKASDNDGPVRFQQCSRCLSASASYCSKECQRHHWPLHRAVCSNAFELFDSPWGKGLRARRSFEAGDEILREAATLRISNQQAATTREQAEAMHQQAVQVAFDQLTSAKQRAVMDLAVCSQWMKVTNGIATPHGVFQTNSYRLKGEHDGALCLALARINHSCRPNVNHIWRPDLQQTLVFATRHVAAGDELFTTYGPSECLNTAGRRSYLQEGFSFHCMCDMCSEQESLGGDARMVQVHNLHAALPMTVHQGHHQKAIQMIDQCVDLLRKQGIGSGVFTMPLFHFGYQVALMGLKDNTLARVYLVQQLEAVVQCEGIGSPDALRLQGLLNSMPTVITQKR